MVVDCNFNIKNLNLRNNFKSKFQFWLVDHKTKFLWNCFRRRILRNNNCWDPNIWCLSNQFLPCKKLLIKPFVSRKNNYYANLQYTPEFQNNNGLIFILAARWHDNSKSHEQVFKLKKKTTTRQWTSQLLEEKI